MVDLPGRPYSRPRLGGGGGVVEQVGLDAELRLSGYQYRGQSNECGGDQFA